MQYDYIVDYERSLFRRIFNLPGRYIYGDKISHLTFSSERIISKGEYIRLVPLGKVFKVVRVEILLACESKDKQTIYSIRLVIK